MDTYLKTYGSHVSILTTQNMFIESTIEPIQPCKKDTPAIKEIQSNLTLRTFFVTTILVLEVKSFLSWRSLQLILLTWSLTIWFLNPIWFLSWWFLKSSLTVLYGAKFKKLWSTSFSIKICFMYITSSNLLLLFNVNLNWIMNLF